MVFLMSRSIIGGSPVCIKAEAAWPLVSTEAKEIFSLDGNMGG